MRPLCPQILFLGHTPSTKRFKDGKDAPDALRLCSRQPVRVSCVAFYQYRAVGFAALGVPAFRCPSRSSYQIDGAPYEYEIAFLLTAALIEILDIEHRIGFLIYGNYAGGLSIHP
jgi:hypothetical protein